MKCQSCENHCENQNSNNFLYNKNMRPFPVRRRPFCENAFEPKFYFMVYYGFLVLSIYPFCENAFEPKFYFYDVLWLFGIIHLSIYPFIHLSIYPFIHLSIYPFCLFALKPSFISKRERAFVYIVFKGALANAKGP